MTSPDSDQARRTGARERGAAARRRLDTTPARVWLLTTVCAVAIAGLFGSAALTLGQARDGLDVLGRDGPQAEATTELYLALADMDARVADMLLMGTAHDLGSGREEVQKQYEASRTQAGKALLQVASLIEGDYVEKCKDVEECNVRAVLAGMGAYEEWAAEALLLNDEAQAPPGRVDREALETYLRATRLMHTELLPKAFNLGLDSSASVRANHEERQEAVTIGLLWVGAAGAVTVAALVGLQMYLRARFRRRFNAPLTAATAGAVLLTAGVVLALVTSNGHQHDAKEEGLDAAMSLSRAGAITTDMQVYESRYLVDPANADNYQQVYLGWAQQVLSRPANNWRPTTRPSTRWPPPTRTCRDRTGPTPTTRTRAHSATWGGAPKKRCCPDRGTRSPRCWAPTTTSRARTGHCARPPGAVTWPGPSTSACASPTSRTAPSGPTRPHWTS